MQGILYEEGSIWVFLFVTVLLGGAAAWQTGKAMATTWKSWGLLAIYIAFLGIAVRFIHHALFEGTMFSLQYYIADTIILFAIAALGYRFTRTRQMVTQYSWLYERTGPLSWRPRQPASPSNQ